MKSERRHELQTNALADWVGHQIDAARPHVGLIATLILAGVAVVVAWMYFAQWNTSQSREAWSDYLRAADSSDSAALMEMAKRHAGEPASQWALLLAADIQLAQGADRSFSDRKEAQSLLAQAAKGYEAVLKDGREPLVRRRALYGLGESRESLYAVTGDKADLEAARKAYQQVAQQWPETVLGRTAANKDAALASRATQDFLAWFSKQQPVGSEMPGASEESAGSPFDLTTLPGAADLLLPDEETAPVTPPSNEVKQPGEEESSPPATEPPGEKPASPPADEATPEAPQPEKAPSDETPPAAANGNEGNDPQPEPDANNS